MIDTPSYWVNIIKRLQHGTRIPQVLRAPCWHATPEQDVLYRLLNATQTVEHRDALLWHLASIANEVFWDTPELVDGFWERFWEKNQSPSSRPSFHCCFPVLLTDSAKNSMGAENYINLLGFALPKGATSRITLSPSLEGSSSAIEKTILRDNQQSPCHWFLWHCPKDNRNISGASLCLPLALALHCAAQKRVWPKNFFATGALDGDKILGVSGVKEKICLKDPQKALVFIPQDNAPELGLNETISYPQSSLTQALYDFDLLLSGSTAQNFPQIKAGLQNQDNFLTHFFVIPASLFYKGSKELDGIKAQLQQGWENCVQVLTLQRADAFIDSLARTLQACAYDKERGAFLSSIAPEPPPHISGQSYLLQYALFTWSIAQINFFNHQGLVENSERWQSFQNRIAEHIAHDNLLHAENFRFVHERFNCYHFSPNLPEKMQALLEEEEARNSVAYRPNANLGDVFGTLAQNAGFCGDMEGLKYFVQRARESYGNKYRHLDKRTQSYLLFATLEQRDEIRAGEILCEILEEDEASPQMLWLRVKENSNPFILHGFLRFLQLQKCSARLIQDIADYVADKYRENHPWQLICYNLAQLCILHRDKNGTRQYIDIMLKICNEGGATTKVMALLGISLLHHHGQATEQDLTIAQDTFTYLEQDTSLNRAHFHTMRRLATTEQRLAYIFDNQEKLFPFTYR